MDETLTIDPARMSDEDWAIVKNYLRDAADAGEVVSLSTHVQMLTPAQAAERLGMSRSTISRRIKAGEIETVKVGAHHRIPLREFERFRDTVMADMIKRTSADLEADLYGG